MRWGHRKSHRYLDTDIVIEKGTQINRVVPKTFLENEKQHKGLAYAAVLEKDKEVYRKSAKLFAKISGGMAFDMSFKAKELIVSPGDKHRVDLFIETVSKNPKIKKELSSGVNRLFVSPKTLDNLNTGDRKTERAYRRFSFLLVSNRNIRDPYFKTLEAHGYNMVIDDGDKRSGTSEAPIIIFDRGKSLTKPKIKQL